MTSCFFVSDLHGQVERYATLFRCIEAEPPAAVFLGGDLLPAGIGTIWGIGGAREDFVTNFLAKGFLAIRDRLGDEYPEVFLILGNDDSRFEEAAVLDAATRGAWTYLHERRIRFGEYVLYGYANVPPTPYHLKDWERYDVSRHVDPGCIPPTEGWRSIPVPRREQQYRTITKDLARLVVDDNLEKAVFLFHAPPYKTALDRAPLDDQMIDYAPLDVHIGSIALRRFIESLQPWLTLHGHAHDSARLTGSWQDRIGRTVCLSAAHHGPELALVRFDLDHPEQATRELL